MSDDGSDGYPSPFLTGLSCRCPRCGKGRLFCGFLRPCAGCSVCGLDYGFADTGDGPAVFAIFIVGFAVVSGVVVSEFMFMPPYWVHAVIWGPLTIILSLGVLRPLKGFLICQQFCTRAREGSLSSGSDGEGGL